MKINASDSTDQIARCIATLLFAVTRQVISYDDVL